MFGFLYFHTVIVRNDNHSKCTKNLVKRVFRSLASLVAKTLFDVCNAGTKWKRKSVFWHNTKSPIRSKSG